MGLQLLDLPVEVRRHILEYAIKCNDHYVCRHHVRDNGFRYPSRGFQQNPMLNLRLVCSQIHSELRDFEKKWLSLRLCDEDCAGDYLRHYLEVAPFIRSINFTSRFFCIRWDLDEAMEEFTEKVYEPFLADWEIELGSHETTCEEAGSLDVDLERFCIENTAEPIQVMYIEVHLQRR